MKRNLVLFFWIAGILFPMGWFIQASPLGYRLFNNLLSPEWTHIAMHTFLFAVLAAMLMLNLYGRLDAKRAVWIVLALVLTAAILQEGIQLLSQQRLLNRGNIFDIGVDMVGGLLGLLIFLGVRKMAEDWEWRFPIQKKSDQELKI